MKIREMELLVRVADTGSMTKAARQLQVTPAAVSATVQRIEEAIGIRLFERTTRSLHPTDEGLVVIEGCQEAVERWYRALEEARGQGAELEGTIHLTGPADTTYELLGEIAATFNTDNPRTRVVLHTSDAVRHLLEDAIDVAIRYGPLEDSTLTARKLAESPRVLVASPGYLEQHGMPDSPAALIGHRCVTLHLANAPVVTWRLRRGTETREVTLKSTLCGDGYLARRWAISGRGIAFKALFDVIDDLEAGRLVHVMPAYSGDGGAIHALHPSRRFLPRRVRALTDAIASQFEARAGRCEAWIRSGAALS
ncbi:MAG: LysR family transcriptional regulator [Proteobacteria bacterium]|nr:LysR family transcriptional regulator [Pseudomonadota bacterium]